MFTALDIKLGKCVIKNGQIFQKTLICDIFIRIINNFVAYVD